MNFSEYAQFYDLLYGSKDYRFEFKNLIDRLPSIEIKNVLELGCGTGSYTKIAAENYNEITAIDLSEDMINLAKTRNNRHNISYSVGDMRNIKFSKKFDLIFSLFHVFSYLNSPQALEDAFKCVDKNLNPDGLLCFDVWSSAGLVNNSLEVRRKEINDGKDLKLIRYSYSTHNPQSETVMVNFDVIALEKGKHPKFFQEQHLMKYWSMNFIKNIASKYRLELIETFDLHTGSTINNNSFGVTYLLQKKP